MRTHKQVLLAILFAGAVNSACIAQTAKLPPVEQRTILGTWVTTAISGSCTRSFENVKGKVYHVTRCSDGSGGKTGDLLSQASHTKFLARGSTYGDHYVILANGDLSVRDRTGEIDVEPKSASLWPGAKAKVATAPKAEDVKTVGLPCYDVGYRYGHTATSGLHGKQVNPAWNFVTPDRCKNEDETQRGILAGTRAAW